MRPSGAGRSMTASLDADTGLIQMSNMSMDSNDQSSPRWGTPPTLGQDFSAPHPGHIGQVRPGTRSTISAYQLSVVRNAEMQEQSDDSRSLHQTDEHGVGHARLGTSTCVARTPADIDGALALRANGWSLEAIRSRPRSSEMTISRALAGAMAVAIMATQTTRIQKAEEANPAPQMLEEKRSLIGAGKRQRAVKRSRSSRRRTRDRRLGKHVSGAPTNSDLSSQEITSC